MEKINTKNNVKLIAYAGIIFVVLVWGLVPPTVSYIYDFYSGAVYSAATSLIAAISLLLLSVKKLDLLTKDMLKIAIPTGIFNGLADLVQKIGLQYTTPTKYAFLENLSCVVVPILLFILIRKRPGVLTIAASIVCLAGSFVLTGMNFSDGATSFGIGEILCALAGCFYGVNIAITGTYAKKFYAPLYVMVQIWVRFVISSATAVVLNFININGQPIEQFKFSFDIWNLLVLLALGLVSNTLCWTIRTNAMKYISPNAVAIIMPFAAVVTGVASVALGMDELTPNLLIGAGLGLAAALMCSFDDILEGKRANKNKSSTDDASDVVEEATEKIS